MPSKGDRVFWHLQARPCVSLRQMLQSDTIEFRHWPGTIRAPGTAQLLQWCRRFIIAAMNNAEFEPLLAWARNTKFPTFPNYLHWMERRYRATVHDGTLKIEDIVKNIKLIEEGKFDDQPVVRLVA